MKALRILGAILLIIAGIALVPTPGPGLVLMLLGAALLAKESPRVARALAAIQLRLRSLLQRIG